MFEGGQYSLPWIYKAMITMILYKLIESWTCTYYYSTHNLWLKTGEEKMNVLIKSPNSEFNSSVVDFRFVLF